MSPPLAGRPSLPSRRPAPLLTPPAWTSWARAPGAAGGCWPHDHAGPSPRQGPGPLPSLHPPDPREPPLPLMGLPQADAREGSATLTRLPPLDFRGAPPHFGQMVESGVGSTLLTRCLPRGRPGRGSDAPFQPCSRAELGSPPGNSQRKLLTARGSLKGCCYQRWGGDGGGSGRRPCLPALLLGRPPACHAPAGAWSPGAPSLRLMQCLYIRTLE